MSKSNDGAPVATLMPLENWHRIYRLTRDTVTKDAHKGMVLGVEIERRWIELDKTNWSLDYVVVESVPAFEVKHPDFTVVIEASELQYLSRERRVGEKQQVACLLHGDFEAYDNFQVLLKMIGDDDLADEEDF